MMMMMMMMMIFFFFTIIIIMLIVIVDDIVNVNNFLCFLVISGSHSDSRPVFSDLRVPGRGPHRAESPD